MADLQSTDQFLVNRSDSTATVTAANLMATILDDDLMLVNRGDQTYKVTGADVKDSLGTKPIYPEPDEITGSPDFQGGTGTQLDPFILQTIDVRPGGASGQSVETITIAVAGAEENQPVIWTNNSDQQLTGTRFDQPSGIVGADGTWTGRLVYRDVPDTTVDTDYTGDLQIGDVYFRWTVEQGIDPTRPIDPTPDQITSNPAFQGGSGTQGDPYLLESISVAPAGSNGQSVELITIAEVGAQTGDLVRWTDNSTGAGDRFAQPEGVINANGLWSGHLVYNDIPDTAVDQEYTGDLQIGETYFRWIVDQRVLSTVPPAIASVSLVESNPDADPRFTDQEFVATVNMAEEGIPQSTKTIDAHVKGEIKTKVQFKEPLESSAQAPSKNYTAGIQGSEGVEFYDSEGAGGASMFDGNTETRVYPAGSGEFTVNFDPPLTGTCEFWSDASDGYIHYTERDVSGGSTGIPVDSTAQWRPIGDFQNVISLRFQRNVNTFNVKALRINGQILVDGAAGPVSLTFAAGTDMTSLAAGDDVTQPVVGFDEPLQNYVSQQTPVYADKNRFTYVQGSGGQGFNFGYIDDAIARGFDGIVDNNNQGFLQGQYPNINPNTEKWYYTFPSAIVNPGKVEVHWRVRCDNSKQHYLIINGSTTSVDMTAWAGGNGATREDWQDITQYINDAGGTLTSLGMQTTTINQPTRTENWSAIRVDGKILISDVTESSLVFAGGTNMGLLTPGTQVSQPASQFSAALESSAPGTQPTYNGVSIITGTTGFQVGGKNSPFTGNVTDYCQITGQGSGNTIEWDMLELANQGFDCRGKELEIYFGSNAGNATDMRCQFWSAGYISQILPWVQLPQNDAYVSMGVVPADADIGQLRFYPNNVSMRATTYHIKIGGIHVYSGGPYFPELTFPVGTEMGGLAEGNEVEQVKGTYEDNFSGDLTITNSASSFNGSTGNYAFGTPVTAGQTYEVFWDVPADLQGAANWNLWLARTQFSDCYLVQYNASGVEERQTRINYNQDGTKFGNGWCFEDITVIASTVKFGLRCTIQVGGSTFDLWAVLTKDGVPVVNKTTGTIGSITNTTVQLSSSEGTWTNGETVTGPVKQPKGTVESTDGTTANLQNGTDTGGWVNGVNVTGGGIIPSGTVGSITGTSVTLSSSNDAWVDGAEVSGPLKDKVESNVTKYLKFDNSGNVTELLDAPQDPAYETTDEDPSLTLKFPSTFGSGLAPDDELGAGTTLTVEATASNSAGTSATKSAEVQPEGASNPLNGLVSLWPGNSGTRTITNGIDLVNNDGLVWIKSRGPGTAWHELYDTLRGVQKVIYSNDSGINSDQPNGVTAFNENGFTVGSGGGVNGSGSNIVGWTFAKQAEFFDVVKYPGNGQTTNVVPHNLGAVPACMIVKNLGSFENWLVYHKDLPTPERSWLQLNKNSQVWTDPGDQNWAGSNPDATNFYVGNSVNTNEDGKEFIAYLFADTPGTIKCGAYDGTGTTPQQIDCGFAPQWLMVKCYEGVNQSWAIYDTSRMDGAQHYELRADSDIAEGAEFTPTLNSTGFALNSASSQVNASGGKYLYVAIAEPSTRSMTQEEFNAEALKMVTYNNRRDVHQGELAREERSRIAKELEDQYGVTTEMVEEALPQQKRRGRKKAD